MIEWLPINVAFAKDITFNNTGDDTTFEFFLYFAKETLFEELFHWTPSTKYWWFRQPLRSGKRITITVIESATSFVKRFA